MTELERVLDGEVVEEHPSWEDHLAAFTDSAEKVFKGQLKQAKILASVGRIWGDSSIIQFAHEVQMDKTSAYAFRRVWLMIEDGTLSVRPESPLTMSHLIEASRAEEPQKMLDKAEDEGLSSRQVKALRKELEAPSEARVEEVQTIPCPRCGGSGSIIVEEGEVASA